MWRVGIALVLGCVVGLAAAGGASAKTTRALTLSEELPGGELRALQPGDPYFATDEIGFVSAYLTFEDPHLGYIECRESASSTYFGKVQSNGQKKDRIILEGVTGGLNGEGGTCYGPAGWGEVTIALSGFPFTLTLGPWSEEDSSKTDAGTLKGHPVVTVHSSAVGSCAYHGPWGTVHPSRRLHGEKEDEPTPQDWGSSIPKLKAVRGNPVSCPPGGGIARFINGSLEGQGPGQAPITLTWE